ncbi:tail fiber assembly protein [Enterobacter asburiae]|uniref:tail fiber assembly protein n=1 Tax=Enterobacter asburiae TaxID=61645 RepID=UPI002B241648|nr:tail fiber assembly protein [Enterobacter asburiae]MEB2410384.1 tail fiber assembly protein [Enterobacter asburiae]
MNYFFSAITNGFYAEALKDAYEQAGTWPDDAKEIEHEHYTRLMEGQQAGKTIMIGDDGLPVLLSRVDVSTAPDIDLPEQPK